MSLKAAIFRDGKLLMVQEADTGFWELPGGRIDVGEEWLPHADVLAREIAEELGADFRVQLLNELVTWARQRPADGVFQFIAARLASHKSGTEQLSTEHAALKWSTPADWPEMQLPERSGYADALQRIWWLAIAQELAG